MNKKETAELIKVVKNFNNKKILVVGDIILDEYITGEVSRISPEAPVPVVRVISQDYSLGGSANVVKNISALGGVPLIIGVTGDDPYNDIIINLLGEIDVDSGNIIKDNSRPSILKSRIIAQNQQVLRIDREETHFISQKIRNQVFEMVKNNISKVNGVVISDYGKGLLTTGLIKKIIAAADKYKKKVIVDPKIEHFMFYKNAAVICPNKKEASLGIGIPVKDEISLQKAGKEIVKRLKLEALIITRSDEGMTLFEKEKIYNIPTVATEVYDVTGAGDTVVGALALALSCGSSYLKGTKIANIAAGEVVKELGSAAVSAEKLIKTIKNKNLKK